MPTPRYLESKLLQVICRALFQACCLKFKKCYSACLNDFCPIIALRVQGEAMYSDRNTGMPGGLAVTLQNGRLRANGAFVDHRSRFCRIGTRSQVSPVFYVIAERIEW